MPIERIKPAPAMTVGHYRSAAIRHMATCRALWHWLELPTDERPQDISDTELLENVFYLTGYIVECAIKYKLLTDVYSLNDGDTETYWRSLSPKVEIKKHFSFLKVDDKTWSERAVQCLKNINSHSIPGYLLEIVNGVPTVGISSERVMQESWGPEIRYHYSSNGLPFPPERAHVDSFFKAAKTLLRNLKVT